MVWLILLPFPHLEAFRMPHSKWHQKNRATGLRADSKFFKIFTTRTNLSGCHSKLENLEESWIGLTI